MNQIATQTRDEAQRLSLQMSKMGDQFKTALPAHITPERFQRVAMTAINRNPELITANRKSLLEACMLAAQDGLLPDGRQAALVIFSNRVQYMPMVAGIRMKVYQSGEITSLVARVAYENDQFEVIYGDDERIEHKPNMFSRGEMIAAYAIATYRDGSKAREVMSIDDIEKVRSVSRTGKSGPWRDWYEEMAKKTVIRRLAKALPLSAELDEFMHRDDGLYDLNQRAASNVQQLRPVEPQTIEARLDDFAAADLAPSQPTGDAADPDPAAQEEDGIPQPETSAEPAPSEAESTGAEDGAGTSEMPKKLQDAMERGRAARQSGYAREVPKTYNYKSRQEEADAFLQGWDEENIEIQAAEAGTV